MIMKKTAALLLVVLLVLFLFSGCSGTGLDSGANTLSLLYGSNVPQSFISALQAKFPEIHFQLEFYQGANYTQYAYDTLTHGEGSDIFLHTLVLTEEDAEAYLLDMSGYTFLGGFDTSILDTVSRAGRIYQLPGPMTCRCMVYNKTLFELYGWQVPTSFQDLLALVVQIRSDAPQITPIAMPVPSAAYPFTLVTSLAQCGFLSTPEGADWEERYFRGEASVAEGFADGLAMVEQLINADAFDAEKYGGTLEPVSGDLCERKAAMLISLEGTGPVLSLLEKTASPEEYGSRCTDDFGLLPFFGPEKGQEGLSISMSSTWGLSRRLEEKGNEKKLENALKVMEYLSTPEAQLLLRTDSGQISTLKNPETTPIHPEVQKLWNLGKNGNKSIFLYAGYEDIMLPAGETVKRAMLADSAEDLRSSFIRTCDTIRRKTLTGQAAAAVYGHVSENLTAEESIRLSMAAVQEATTADFVLATSRGIDNNVINIKGVGGRLFAGDVTALELSTLIPAYGDTIVTAELTGVEVRGLLEQGKTIEERESQGSFRYLAQGLEVEKKGDAIISMKLSGEELSDSETYTVSFLRGDYTDDFARSHTIVDTGIEFSAAIAGYLGSISPVSGEILP